MRCEAQQTVRNTGQCKMLAAPGKRHCRYHDPELKPATMAALKRKQEIYWTAYRKNKRTGGHGKAESVGMRLPKSD